MLYLFDKACPPVFGLWNGLREICFEPYWLNTLLKQDSSYGVSYGLAAGEFAGASEEGGWVACRRITASGATEIGIIARLQDNSGNSVKISAGNEVFDASLNQIIIPGVGWISYTTVLLSKVAVDQPISVNVAGVEGRS
jgi:hypothetical protein